ncbi:MAG: OmpH family outer membrane protein [bacterium]
MFAKRVGPRLLALGGVLIAAALFVPRAHAESKFGYIDSARILAEYKGVEDAKRAFDQEVKVWEKEEDRLRSEIDSLAAEYKSQNLMLTESTRKEKEATLQDKKTAYEAYVRATFGPEGKVAEKNAELMKPIIDKVNVILERIGAEEKFTMIFDASSGGIVYADPGADLTTRVIEELNTGTQ